MAIHPTCLIDSKAEIASDVELGPYCIVGPEVRIASGNKFKGHVIVDGQVEIGENNTFFPYCSIGAPPQDLSYNGDPTRVIIGRNNVFREYVSLHRGTVKDQGLTLVGDNNFFMVSSHLGHDVSVGNNVILVNAVNLAGHVRVGDRAIISGATNVAQWITIGRGSYIGGASAVDRDIPPFCAAYGNRCRIKGVNIVGLRRQGFTRQVISEIVEFYKAMETSALSPRAFVDHKELMEDFVHSDLVNEVAEFIFSTEIGIAPFS